MNWQADLRDTIGTQFLDQSIEEGAYELALMGESYPDYHTKYVYALERALQAVSQEGHAEQNEVMTIIHEANLCVGSVADAKDTLEEIYREYIRQYKEVIAAPKPVAR